MKKNLKRLTAMALVCAMTVLTACGGTSTTSSSGASEAASEGTTEAAASGEKIVTIAQTGDWDSFMPMNTTNSGADNINELMFDRLMTINTDGTFEPRLANSWETNETSDKIIYHLNENAK